jgi:hypothetical protein
MKPQMPPPTTMGTATVETIEFSRTGSPSDPNMLA